MVGRGWDASSYDRVGGPMTEMAAALLDRLELSGDETVLDAGCGTGRVSQLLVDRLPRGRVLAVDADPEMVRVARRNLGERAQVDQADLLELELDEPVDAVLSTATFHWVLDHATLFRRLHDALRPGGRLVAQFGGRGNIAALRTIADDLATEAPFARWFAGWEAPWHYPGPEETAERLQGAGFTEVATWLQPWPVVPDDPVEYLATVTLGAQVQRLPVERRQQFVQAVIDRCALPVTVGYVRLNVDARRPG
ncbi:MAG: class I SAM-dependent methyltransferase [Acidimicrobiales bacterium]